METLTYREPRLVALALLVLIAAGLSSLLAIGRQEDPTITNVFATITTVYPGADPARVEALVTSKLEGELREVPEVDVIESTSGTGISIVSIELLERIADERIEQVWSEVRDVISDTVPLFPAGVLEPEFSSEGAGAYATIISLQGRHDGVSTTIISRHAEDLADRLRNLPGTKLVELYGAPDEEILVDVDLQSAAALGLTADDISVAVRSADSKVQAGRVRGASNELVISVEGEITALDRLRHIVLREHPDGAVTQLSDIATVTRGARSPVDELAINNGRNAVLVAAKVQDGLQVDVWMDHVRTALDEYARFLPASIEQDTVFDQSTYTTARLVEVGTNMAIGVGLVVAVLFITLGARAAMIVALVLPLVSLASLASMNAMGLAIHQMSVTGLIVALGLLVDAAIVMTDEVSKRIQSGRSRVEAVAQAVRRLFVPLFASTITTVLSFTPMILLPGPAGDFVGSIAVAVVTMLLWSFVIAVTITPAIAGWMLPEHANRGILANGIGGGLVGRLFKISMTWAISNPVKSIALALVLPITGFAAFPTLTAQFFPGVDRDQFHIEVEMPAGAAIAQTSAIVKQIDSVLRSEEEIRTVTWVVGRSAPAFYYNIVGNRDSAPAFAQALVSTISADATERLLPALQNSLDERFLDARILVRGLVQGPPVNAPVELRFVGDDIGTLREIGDQAREILASLDMVTVARTSVTGGAPKLSIDVDEAKAHLLGLDLGAIARQLESALEGVTGGSLVEQTEELPVRVRADNAIRGNPSAISTLPILPPNAASISAQGSYPGIPLSSLATIELVPSESVITRRNAERVNTVQAFLVQGVLPEEALKAANAELVAHNFELPHGYRLEFGGDSDARSSTLNNLLASLGLIVTLSIAVIVLTFNSFRLSAVAFAVASLSAGLSMFALAVFQYPFGINAVIGVIGSIGVSINAAIIILTGLQENARAARGDKEAMVDVVIGSSRHIVSTTVTTFGGFLPLILQGGGFWPPFAMSIAGGVLLSTIVSFYFTPPMFALVYRRNNATKQNVAKNDDHVAATSNVPMRIAAE